jgi:hypothetical protein
LDAALIAPTRKGIELIPEVDGLLDVTVAGYFGGLD